MNKKNQKIKKNKEIKESEIQIQKISNLKFVNAINENIVIF